MKKRRVLKIEQLEARETPDVSLGHAAPFLLSPLLGKLALLGQDAARVSEPLLRLEQLERAGNDVAALQESASTTAPALSPEESFSQEGFSWQSLQALLSDSRDLARLLASSTITLPATESPSSLVGELRSEEAELQAWRFLSNYTRKAISNEEARYGLLPDHEDIVHQVFVEWREQVGVGEQAFTSLLDKNSTERLLLRKTVRRVLDHTRYEYNRNKRMVELIDQPAPTDSAEQDWIDVQIDWASKLGPRERQMLELRRQGMTFEEIGSEMGLLKQRVYEMYTSALDSLQELYCPCT